MSTFYVVPARPQLGRWFSQFLETLFPDLHWPTETWNDLAETLGAAAQARAGAYVVYREDLPPSADVLDALVESFGAEAGDEVIEVWPENKVCRRSWIEDDARLRVIS